MLVTRLGFSLKDLLLIFQSNKVKNKILSTENPEKILAYVATTILHITKETLVKRMYWYHNDVLPKNFDFAKKKIKLDFFTKIIEWLQKDETEILAFYKKKLPSDTDPLTLKNFINFKISTLPPNSCLKTITSLNSKMFEAGAATIEEYNAFINVKRAKKLINIFTWNHLQAPLSNMYTYQAKNFSVDDSVNLKRKSAELVDPPSSKVAKTTTSKLATVLCSGPLSNFQQKNTQTSDPSSASLIAISEEQNNSEVEINRLEDAIILLSDKALRF